MSTTATPTRPCPICKKPAVEQFKPFCSKRCADVDLHRWLSDAYVIPGQDGSAVANDMLAELGDSADKDIDPNSLNFDDVPDR